MAEGVGFEPTEPFGSSHFKCDAIDHSTNLPISMRFLKVVTPSTIVINESFQSSTVHSQTSSCGMTERSTCRHDVYITLNPAYCQVYLFFFPKISTLTVQIPPQPIFLAAALDRSKCLPLMNGPLSFITTITDLPLCVTLSLVPKGSVLCAAVKAFGLNLCPLAVILFLLHSPGLAQSYHDAFIVDA